MQQSLYISCQHNLRESPFIVRYSLVEAINLALFSLCLSDVEHYVTIEKYTAEEEDELSFPKGVTVDVLQKSLDGWWLIKYNGKAALAPATFLVKKPSEESQVRALTECGLKDGMYVVRR